MRSNTRRLSACSQPEEEVGLNGAQALDKSQITARTMINMDSEEEGVATISCAGGLRVQLTRKVERTAAEGTLVQVKIEGLLGGHSGTDIDKERQNANVLMARMVDQIMKNTDGKLVTFAGGTKDNAITRECAASLIYADKAEAEKAEKLAAELAETFADEISAFEPDFACEVSVEEGQSAAALKDEDAKAFIGAIRLAPNGVYRRNIKMDGFVVVSSNLGVTRADEDELVIVISPRSSVASLQETRKRALPCWLRPSDSRSPTADSIRDGITKKIQRSAKYSWRVTESCSAAN